MKMKKLILFSEILLILSLITWSCKKEQTSGNGQIEFSMAVNSALNNLKSAQSSATASAVLITIEDASGKIIKNAEKIDLYNMSGDYISQPVSLASGNYRLTKFLVLDADSNVLYASPLKGSAKAGLVQQPLPIAFSAQTNAVVKLVPEVVNTSESTPESFGYASFSFSVAQTFDFLLGTFIYNENIKNYQLTTATISILSDTSHVYNGQLNASAGLSNTGTYDSIGITNKITLPALYNNYTLVISKTGYKTYTKTFTIEELKLHYRSIDKGPLVIILEAEPVDTSLYIKGYFGSKYLNYSAKQYPAQCTYYNSWSSVSNSYFGFFGIFVYENASIKDSSQYIEVDIYPINLDDPQDNFDIDHITFPYTLNSANTKVTGRIIIGAQACHACGGTYIGAGFSQTGDVTVTIESKVNEVIYGTFSGVLTGKNGEKISVSDGEFHGKMNRIVYPH
jgi:hypothetical protein